MYSLSQEEFIVPNRTLQTTDVTVKLYFKCENDNVPSYNHGTKNLVCVC